MFLELKALKIKTLLSASHSFSFLFRFQLFLFCGQIWQLNNITFQLSVTRRNTNHRTNAASRHFRAVCTEVKVAQSHMRSVQLSSRFIWSISDKPMKGCLPAFLQTELENWTDSVLNAASNKQTLLLKMSSQGVSERPL